MKKTLIAICLFLPAFSGAQDQKAGGDVDSTLGSPTVQAPQTQNLDIGNQIDNSSLNSGNSDLPTSPIETGPHPAATTIAPINTHAPITLSDTAQTHQKPAVVNAQNTQIPNGTNPQANGTQQSTLSAKSPSLTPGGIPIPGNENAGLLQNKTPDVESLQFSLKKIFDGERPHHRKINGKAPPPIQGKTENFFDKVYQTASVAASASSYDAPKLFSSALSMTQEAKDKRTITAHTETALQSALLLSAFKKAEQSLPLLLKETAQAALSQEKSAFIRGLKAFSEWQNLLGSPQKPLITNAPTLTAYLQNLFNRSKVQSLLAQNPINSSLRIKESRKQFTAELPPFEIGEIPLKVLGHDADLNANKALLPLISDQPQIFNSSTNIGWKTFYSLERNIAGHGSVESGFEATKYSTEIAIEEFWHWVLGLMNHFKAPRLIDLGNKITIKTHNPAFRRLLTFERKTNEASIGQTVFFDLKSINEPYFNFKRAPSLELANNLAVSYQKLSGDASGAQGLSDLSRHSSQSLTKEIDPQVLSYWVERMHDSAIAFLFQALKRASQNAKKPIIFADIENKPSEGMILIAGKSPAPKTLLTGLGFDLADQDGWTYALISQKGAAIQKTLKLAQQVLSGQITSIPQHHENSLPVLDARTQTAINQAIRAYAGLKDNQAMIQWWAGYSQSPNAKGIARVLAAKLIKEEGPLGLSKKSVQKLLTTINKTLPRSPVAPLKNGTR